MAAFAIPLPSANLEAWRAFIAELNGPREGQFADFNRRWGLDRHQAYLQTVPDGYLVLAVHDGPGGSRFLAEAPHSTNEFDRWFIDKLSELHGVDVRAMEPPQVELALDADVPAISS